MDVKGEKPKISVKNPVQKNQEVNSCIQCGKCSSGCAGSGQTSDSPRKVIRLLQWGLEQEAAYSPMLASCKQCQYCTKCCPAGVDVARIIRNLVKNRFFEDDLK